MRNLTRPSDGESLLRYCVETLAFGIGERCSHRLQALEAAARFVEAQLTAVGMTPERQTYLAGGRPYHVIVGEVPGEVPSADPIVIAAHTDAALIFPPSCDDIFGAAALLGLAAAVAGKRFEAPIRFVICVDLEWTDRSDVRLGNCLYAQRCKERDEDLQLVLSVHGLGAGVLPTSAALARGRPTTPPLTFVGDLASWRRARQCARTFTQATGLSASWGAPSICYPALQSSDHLAFARQGYPALAVTTGRAFVPASTRPFHHVDYRSLATYVWGLETVLESSMTQTIG